MRYLSDKPSDNDGKAPEPKAEVPDSRKKMSDTEKIQELLKKMMAEPKISEKEYREKFATAPEIPRKRKQKPDEIEVKTEKIGKISYLIFYFIIPISIHLLLLLLLGIKKSV